MISIRSALVCASLLLFSAPGGAFAGALAGPAPPAAAPEAPAAHEAPIVSGRSVASRRGSKLHHVRTEAAPLLMSAQGPLDPPANAPK